MIATVVDWSALWQAVWTAAVAGFLVILIFAIAVHGAARAQDARRSANHVAMGGFGLVAVLGGAATVGAVIYAITVITTK